MVGDRASLLLGSGSWVLALMLAGCGGDNSGDRGGAGSTGTTGGSTGTGGNSTTMSGGSGGGGGGAALVPYPCEPKAPDTAEMTKSITSDGKWGGAAFGGGTFTFGDADMSGKTDVALTFPDATIKAVGNIATYIGFGLWFAPATGQTYPCIDANGYKGVSFHVVDNSTTTTKMVFSVQTHDNAPIDTANKRGACVWTDPNNKFASCASPSATVTVPAGGGVVEVPWSAFMSGKPVANVPDGGALLDGLQWQFDWMTGYTAYDADITIKDVKFY